MKKYVALKCSTCDRQKDQLVDLTHYTPDKCTITLGCEGRLSPIGYTSDSRAQLGVPPSGLVNWYPRGSTISATSSIKQDSLYDTSTGEKHQIVLAVPHQELGFAPGSEGSVILNLVAEEQTSKDFRQYTYRRSNSFTIINGLEDGLGKKVLRYNITGESPDKVEVYLNGIKQTRGAQYELYDGTPLSAVPLNSILFTTVQTGANTQVDVIVTQEPTQTITTLLFDRMIGDEARVNIGAWEGVSTVSSPALGVYSLMYCDFDEVTPPLAFDVKFRFHSVKYKDTPTSAEIPLNGVVLLLSRSKVHTSIDRERSKWIKISNLRTDTEYFVTKKIDGARALLVTEKSAVDLFPILDVQRYNDPSLLKTNLGGSADAAELDNQIIVGPDA